LPHHKSAMKRVKTNAKRNLRNRFAKKTLRTKVKQVRLATDPEKADKALHEAISALDKAARKGFIHKNKAARSTSRLVKFVNKLKAQ